MEINLDTQQCTGHCGLVKSLSEYQKAKGYKNGHQRICKKCKYEKTRKWLKSKPEHQDQANQSQQKWYVKNGVEYHKEWRNKNRERINQLAGELRRKEREPIKSNSTKGIARPQFRGKNSPNWKGGRTSERESAMRSIEYKEWRFLVFKRDDFRCVLCPVTQNLQAHHIIPWSHDEGLRYDPNNGITLCYPCHCLVNGNEETLIVRFQEYINGHPIIPFTEGERLQFLPLRGSCTNCEKEVIKPNWHKNRKLHFCDMTCKKGYEAKIGFNWGGGRKSNHYLVPCDQCGQELDLPEFRYKRTQTHFCNRTCKGLFSRK